MDRAAMLATLTRHYGPVAGIAGVPVADTPAAFGPVMDATEDALDAIAGELVGTSEGDRKAAPWALPFLRYYALDLLADRLTAKMNVSTGGDSFSLQQTFANVDKRLGTARAAVAWYVEPAPPASAPTDDAYANGGQVITWRG